MDKLKMGAVLGQSETVVTPLPLQGTDVNATVTGPVANVTVTQFFDNIFQEPITLQYVFPLPERAAVVDYEITIGERTIQAEIKEREAARRSYNEAVARGQRVSLLEQQQPNLFAVDIGNVQPGEMITTQLVYEDRLRYRDGRYEFVFPMGIAPKYHDPATAPPDAATAERPFEDQGAPVADATISMAVDGETKL